MLGISSVFSSWYIYTNVPIRGTWPWRTVSWSFWGLGTVFGRWGSTPGSWGVSLPGLAGGVFLHIHVVESALYVRKLLEIDLFLWNSENHTSWSSNGSINNVRDSRNATSKNNRQSILYLLFSSQTWAVSGISESVDNLGLGYGPGKKGRISRWEDRNSWYWNLNICHLPSLM